MTLWAHTHTWHNRVARRRVGEAKIREHNHNLAVWAGNMLAKRWGTDVLTPADQIGCMVSVRLPRGTYETEQSVSLARLLRHKYAS